MALIQDVMTRTVNVHWGGDLGAIAVFANQTNGKPNIRYHKNTESGEFKNLGVLEFTINGAVRGCSYAKVTTGPENDPTVEPVFLLCGDDGNDVLGGAVHGIIMLSNDGIKWSTVAFEAGKRFQSMTWNPDEKAFFVQAQSRVAGDFTSRTCWKSTDGHSWAAVSGSFNTHLKYGAEDGQYGFDPSKTDVANAPPLGTTTPDGHLVLSTDFDPPVSNLTFAGGVWFYSGQDDDANENLYESVDDTRTWESIGKFGSNSEDSIFPLIAGAVKDVKAWQSEHPSR